MKIFQQFDFFGDNVSLLYNGNKNIRTPLGGLFCFISGIIFILLLIGFGQDFFKRTNPSFIRETESPKDFPKYTISNKNFSLAVRLEDESGNEFNKFTSIYFQASLLQYKKDNEGIWQIVYDGALGLVRCTEDMFYSKDDFESNYLDNFYCPVLNNTVIGGSWGSNYVGFFSFNVYICLEGEVNNNNNEACEKQEYTDELLNTYNGVYFSHFFQSSIITPSNYTDGIGYSINNEYFLLSKDMKKTYYYYFSLTRMNSDYGWILKTEHEDTVLGYTRKNYDFNLRTDSDIATVYYYTTKDSDLYKREYVKIQTLAANVGGILKIFVLIGSFIVSFYNTSMFHSHLAMNCNYELLNEYDIENEDNNINENLSKSNTLNKKNSIFISNHRNSNFDGEISNTKFNISNNSRFLSNHNNNSNINNGNNENNSNRNSTVLNSFNNINPVNQGISNLLLKDNYKNKCNIKSNIDKQDQSSVFSINNDFSNVNVENSKHSKITNTKKCGFKNRHKILNQFNINKTIPVKRNNSNSRVNNISDTSNTNYRVNSNLSKFSNNKNNNNVNSTNDDYFHKNTLKEINTISKSNEDISNEEKNLSIIKRTKNKSLTANIINIDRNNRDLSNISNIKEIIANNNELKNSINSKIINNNLNNYIISIKKYELLGNNSNVKGVSGIEDLTINRFNTLRYFSSKYNSTQKILFSPYNYYFNRIFKCLSKKSHHRLDFLNNLQDDIDKLISL